MPTPENPNRRRKSKRGHASRPEYAHCYCCPLECHALAPCGALDVWHALALKLAAALGTPQEGRWAEVARAARAECDRAGASSDAAERALAAAVPDPERQAACRRLVRG